MPLTTIAAYNIISHAGKGLPLTVSAGNKMITARADVFLYDKDRPYSSTEYSAANIILNQKWLISALGSGQQVLSANNPQYMLNAQKSTWNCDAYTSNSDSYVNFIQVSTGVYRIQLQSDTTRYLTVFDSFSGVTANWRPLDTTEEGQKWKLVAAPTAKSTILEMPAGRCCNWNQFYKAGIVDVIGSTAGCTITTALDVINYYGPQSYTMSNIKGAWISNVGINWGYSWPGNAFISPNSITVSGQNAYAMIRLQLDAMRPVIVHIKNNVKNLIHTVMCYGYTNGGTSDTHFLVMDPAGQGKLVTDIKEGTERTLAEAMSFNHKPDGIIAIRLTSLK